MSDDQVNEEDAIINRILEASTPDLFKQITGMRFKMTDQDTRQFGKGDGTRTKALLAYLERLRNSREERLKLLKKIKIKEIQNAS